MNGRYTRPIPPAPPERQQQLDQSAKGSINLTLRDVRCPRCGYLIIKVYSDTIGHIRPKCPKCKARYAGPRLFPQAAGNQPIKIQIL